MSKSNDERRRIEKERAVPLLHFHGSYGLERELMWGWLMTDEECRAGGQRDEAEYDVALFCEAAFNPQIHVVTGQRDYAGFPAKVGLEWVAQHVNLPFFGKEGGPVHQASASLPQQEGGLPLQGAGGDGFL